MIPWKQHHARRYSRDAVGRHQWRLWAWVANSYRLRGYDDDRCIREACEAVTACHALRLEDAAYTGHAMTDRKSGPRPPTTQAVPSIYRARHALRTAAAASKKRPQGGRGE